MRSRATRQFRLFAPAALVLALASPAARAVTFTVDTTDDTVDVTPGDGTCADTNGHCSLRAAVMETNALVGNDEIDLPAGTYLRTLDKTTPDTEGTGDLDITDGLLIRGDDARTTIIDANNMDRVLQMALLPSLQPVELRDVTLQHGYEGDGAGGGGIYNQAPLTLTRVRVLDNHENGNGGGLYTTSNPTYIYDSAIESNTASASGAGIDVYQTLVEIHRGSISNNIASWSGGGVVVASNASFVAQDLTISGNQASTSSGGGGGISTGNTTIQIILRDCTVTGNSAYIGGGFYKWSNTVFLSNTILAGNSATTGPDCHAYTAWTSEGYNLVGSTSDCPIGGVTTGNLTGVDPQVGSLQDNGGLGLSQLPLPGSPVVDAGNPETPDAGETWLCSDSDQAGQTRPLDGDGDGTARCDIGAVEMVPFDFGDAPDSPYPTLFADDGARHAMVGTLWLGATRDGDGDGQPSATATGDDSDGSNDDDGVKFPLLVVGQSGDLTITATATGLLDAWIDFNGDGIWGEGAERVATSVPVTAGDQALTVDVPADATLGLTFARFRLSTAGGLSPLGAADDGEVEDYQVRILQTVFVSSFDSGDFTGWSVVQTP